MSAKRVKSTEAAGYDVAAAAVDAGEAQILRLAFAIMDRQQERGEAMTDPASAGRYCQGKLRGREREVFGVMFMDTRHRLIAWEELFYGTVDGAEVHPREVVKAALRHNAAAVIVSHNHPSGSPEPSHADRAVTARLKQSLALVDVRLLDHFVIGDGAPVSLASRGWV